MLSQAVYWSKRTNEKHGWFYKTQEEWEEETGLTRREQETARRRLKEIGVLQEKYQGVPRKVYFRICAKALSASLTSLHESAILECTNASDCNEQTSHAITENTTENTTESLFSTSDDDANNKPWLDIPLIESSFETFWSAGMVKKSKKRALEKFASLVKDGKLDPVEFAGKLYLDVQARIKSNQYGFDQLYPATYLNQERWNDEISTGNSAPANSTSQSYSHAGHQAELEQWKQAMLNGGDGQRCNVVGPDAGDLRGEVESGSWSDTTNGHAISLDDGDWTTEP